MLDCPVYKNHLMHDITPPCNGCQVSSVAQVRSHLRTRAHSALLSFVQQCSRCKEDFVNEESWKQHTTANACEHRSQIRGDTVAAWVRLYLTLFPDSSKVPSPWSGEHILLSFSVNPQRVTPRSTGSRNFDLALTTPSAAAQYN
jgi:hypothetical protein